MTTPMFGQYRALKAAHPDAILFFRMGDFFEVFFEDAVLCARELELTLTSRNRNDPIPVPMAGVPHHAAPGYIQRLVDAGYRVAIAEQTEDPALAKGLVRREVVRVVTPGVVFDPTTLQASRANWLVAVTRGRDGFGLAFLDVSTGDLRSTTVGQAPTATAELQRFGPREALLGPGVSATDLGDGLQGVTLSRGTWEDATGEGAAADAVAAVLQYARDQLGGRVTNIQPVVPYRADGFMVLDETTRRNLELQQTVMGGTRKGSLLALVDLAETAVGSRRLADWLVFPLLDPAAIARRSSAVQALVEDPASRAAVRAALSAVADIERITARVSQGSANARDIAALGRSLAAVPGVVDAAAGLQTLAAHLPTDACDDLRDRIQRTLVDEPPIGLAEGGFIRDGVSAELDEYVRLSLDSVSILDRMEAEEREQTGISSLKIRRNKVFGLYIEITSANLHKVPDRYLRKQTLSNCERYLTSELKDLEDKVLGADVRRKELELELFRELRVELDAHASRLLALARALSVIDALAALAEVAVRNRWNRPVVDGSGVLDIVAGRHPMVEAALDEDRFVPNDVCLDPDDRLLVVLTGPNMAGKSTVLRQVAIIALLAHMGSFVPADRARIGICDRIFTRVGAADDLRRGRSTFMVEMAETASILHHATSRSLVVLDEIGRGTSTFDGLAIAWAVAEDLHDRIGCRGLFATHYHELCELAEDKPRMRNQHVAVSENGGEIVFLRRLEDGGASRSYGIQCAKLAGLPTGVISRARTLLTRFEKQTPEVDRRQLGLFGAPPPRAEGPAERYEAPAPPPEPAPDLLREALATFDPDQLSPREAHAALYTLRTLR